MKYMLDKVFEALEILSRALEFNDEGEFQSGRLWRIIFNDMVDDKEKSIIEQALTELKTIKEAKPSEAIKGLKHIKNYYVPEPCSSTTYEYLEIIKQALIKAQEQEKVLDIIFEKNVDINYLKYNTLHDYNCHILARDRLDTKNQLTQEEFDLLKHYLEKNIQKARLR